MELIVFFCMLAFGFVFGRIAEHRHLRTLQEREQNYLTLPTSSTPTIPSYAQEVSCDVVAGSVVVSIDYFKKVVASLKALFGGRIGAYESLLGRARREAVLRMKEEAIEKGALSVFNVKLETASIYSSANQIGSVEVVAYGTAIIPAP